MKLQKIKTTDNKRLLNHLPGADISPRPENIISKHRSQEQNWSLCVCFVFLTRKLSTAVLASFCWFLFDFLVFPVGFIFFFTLACLSLFPSQKILNLLGKCKVSIKPNHRPLMTRKDFKYQCLWIKKLKHGNYLPKVTELSNTTESKTRES